MALKFLSTAPKNLLETFKTVIDQGHVKTWAYDKDGDFTHTASQWDKVAWLRPVLEQDRLTFNIISPKSKVLTWEIYGIFHGRFIESMIVHCHELFTEGVATAKPTVNEPPVGG